MKKTITWLTTLFYIAFIFGFTTVGRPVSDWLRENELLRPVLLACFFITFLAIGVYLAFFFFDPDGVAFVSLTAVLSLLAYSVCELDYTVERIHFLLFGVLALLSRYAFSLHVGIKTQYFMALLITALVGVGDEIFQYYLPNRFFDWKDVGVNFLAGIIAVLFYEIVENKLNIFRWKRS